MSSWFDKCIKPPWQPPNYVFKYVWPVLYRDVLKLSTPFRGYLYYAYITTVGM